MGARDHCGVAAVSVPGKGAAPYLYLGLRGLQHRGQESAGMATFSHGKLYDCRKMGLVHEIFTRDTMEALRGSVGIGHVRYSTRGTSTVENAQPMVIPTHDGGFALAQNGDIVNYQRLRKRLQQEGAELLGNADTEVIGNYLAMEFEASLNMESAIRRLMTEVTGGYAIVLLHGGKFYAFRDPMGIRPLSLGSMEGGYMVASESVAIELMGGKLVRDVAPGEILVVGKVRGKEGAKSVPTLHPTKGMVSVERAYCIFEWVYFSRPDSVINSSLVYNVRYRIGEMLARERLTEADVVIPVPDSSRPQALGLSHTLGIPYAEGLIKNRFVERTFILPDQKRREEEVRVKLHPIPGIIQGKRVILVDDSIVRGTTLTEIISMVRGAGATEVHVRVGCPPIIAPCYFGVDMKDRRDLIAYGRSESEIAQKLGADSVGYLSISGLVEAIGHPARSLCVGCLTARYPLDVPLEHRRLQRALTDYHGHGARPESGPLTPQLADEGSSTGFPVARTP